MLARTRQCGLAPPPGSCSAGDGRLERLLLKVFTSEEEMNIYLLVDTSRSMTEGAPAKLDYAKKVAAALGYIGLKNLDRVGASLSAGTIRVTGDVGQRLGAGMLPPSREAPTRSRRDEPPSTTRVRRRRSTTS